MMLILRFGWHCRPLIVVLTLEHQEK